MAKDSVKKRLEGSNGMSFTEFSYQLIQGYDFYWLNKNKNCFLQMGGSDQWGNIVTGTELIRRKSGKQAFALTCPLLKKSDGGKFGKTEKGNIWLDPEKTTPYHFYQFWVNASDEDAADWIKIFTFLPQQEIENLISSHQENPSKRLLQKKLAEEVTKFVHGDENLKLAIDTTQQLFDSQNKSVEDYTTSELEAIEGIIKSKLPVSLISETLDVINFLVESKIFPSKGEARKMIANGGISVNRKKVSDVNQNILSDDLLHRKYLLVQKGKKNFYLVEFE
jgi:tyrosyl-tRNA synthetase